jgi:HEAT repeat protein
MITLIEEAYASQDKNWKASALFAMGRSANLRWEPQVMRMLNSPIPQLRSEAARAAGELELSEAGPILIELLDDPDENTRLASIWSLSQLGGEGVLETLERMYEEAEDEEDIEYLQMALDNLAFNQGVQFMPMLVMPEDEFDDEEEIEEIEEETWYEELEELDELLDNDEEFTD